MRNVVMCLLPISFLLISSYAYSQKSYKLGIQISGTCCSQIELEYVTKVNGEFRSSRLPKQQITDSKTQIIFDIPFDFLDLKFIFRAANTNTLTLSSVTLSNDSSTCVIPLSEFSEIIFLKDLELREANNETLTYKINSNSASLRINVSRLKPYLYEVDKIAYNFATIALKLKTTEALRIRIYSGNSSNPENDFDDASMIWSDVPKSNYIISHEFKITALAPIDLLRIDFEGVKQPLQIYEVSLFSKVINRTWNSTNIFDDFQVATEEVKTQLNDSYLEILTQQKYLSLISIYPLKTDRQLRIEVFKEHILLLIILLAIPVLIASNKYILSVLTPDLKTQI